MKTILFTLATILFVVTESFALVTIDSLHVQPVSGNPSDGQQLIIYSTATSSGCGVTNHSATFMNETINISLTYTIGVAAAICHSVDTIFLGNIDQGDYSVVINVHSSDAAFDDFIFRSSMAIQEYSLAITAQSKLEKVQVYPNPFSDHFLIQTEESIIGFKMMNLQGEIVLESTHLKPTNLINTTYLKKGIYVLEVNGISEKMNYKIIKH